MSRLIAVVASLLLLAPACGGPSESCGGGKDCAQLAQFVTIFAASSLQPAFDRMGFGATGVMPKFNFAGTQTLTSQLLEGAHADVFASADTSHMANLDRAGLIDGTATVFAHNRLEIAVEKGNPKHIQSLADLARPGLVVVLADPSVPAGKYAQQALSKAGVMVQPASLEPQVTGVLSKVALGEADAGIVYVSDVKTSGQVEGIAIPDSQNVIADYPIAILKDAADKHLARQFVDRVLSADGQAILEGAGFEKA